MVDFNVATGNTGPLNRTGAESLQVSGDDVQATPVSIQRDGNGGYEVVEADATSGVPAVGVLLHEKVFDPSTLPTGQHFQDLEEQLVNENYTFVGDRGVFYWDGIEVVNNDADTDWDPSQPVYLAEGGGFTDTEPATSGSVVQVMGQTLSPPVQGGDGNGDAGDRFRLDVDPDYTTVA
jgi:hypothetical protein